MYIHTIINTYLKDFGRAYLVHCCCRHYVMCVHHWKVLAYLRSVLKLCHHGLCSMRSAQRERPKEHTVKHQTIGTQCKDKSSPHSHTTKQPMLSDIPHIAIFQGSICLLCHALFTMMITFCSHKPIVQQTIWLSTVHTRFKSLNLY